MEKYFVSVLSFLALSAVRNVPIKSIEKLNFLLLRNLETFFNSFQSVISVLYLHLEDLVTHVCLFVCVRDPLI